MGKIGKISIIPKDYSQAPPSMDKSLRDKGFSRFPGTTRAFFPYRDLNNKYRTGLDEEAKYLNKIEDDTMRNHAKAQVKKLKADLEDKTGLDLSNTSKYYDYGSKDEHHVQMVKLVDGDNIFNLDDAHQAITYYWLCAHPAIASSLQDYRNGKFPSDTQYFVNDDDVENEIEYRKKKTANDAIIRFDSWSLDKRKKVARLLDLPVSEETREEVVYNLVDGFLKSKQVINGTHKGRDPIKVFADYATLKDDVLYIKDLVEQTFRNQIYKEKKGGRIFEGELEVFKDKQEMIEHLLNDDNQEDVLEMEKKLKGKRLARL